MAAARPTSSPPPKPSAKAALWIAIVLAAGTILVYWPVSHHQFVNYDDTDFVTANPHVQAGLTAAGFKWAWHSEVARNWHPITMLTHMLDCQLFGLNPGPPHLVNLFLHTANVLLLFYVLRLMTGAMWRSAFVAALFAWHPLHVESVAWIAERKDVLSTLFWFLVLWAYARYVGELKKKGGKQKRYYALALLFCALGLMSKPMLVTVPFVLLLLDFWPLGRMKPKIHARLFLEKAPFLAMSLILCVITFNIQRSGGAMMTTNNLPLAARVENAAMSYVRYIGNMIWPRHLAALYLRIGDWPAWQVGLAAMTILIVSILVLAQWRRRPWLSFGWFWYLGTLVPVIGLVQVGMQTMADRFTYVSMIGLFIAVTWGTWELAARWHWPGWSVKMSAAAVLGVCLVLTDRQVAYWQDSETLFHRMIAVTRDNFMAHYNLANVYSREKKYDAAETNYAAAVQENPNYADAQNNFAGMLLEEKRYDDAIQHYQAAIRVNPQYLYYFNLANALADTASARHDPAEFAEAIRTYGHALELNPNSSDAHYNLGLTWQVQGKDREAAVEFREAARLKPENELAHFNTANSMVHAGDIDAAIVEYQAAIQLNPNRADSYNGLGLCYARENKMADATRQFMSAVRLDPNNAAANGDLGNALAAQNRLDESIPYYLAALRLNPADYLTEFNLALTFSRMGRRSDAEAHYKQALRINPNYPEAQRALQELEKSGNSSNQK